MRHYRNVCTQKEDENVVPSHSVVVLISKPKVIKSIRVVQKVEKRPKKQRQGQDTICEPKTPPKLAIEFWEVLLESVEHLPSHDEEDNAKGHIAKDNDICEWILNFLLISSSCLVIQLSPTQVKWMLIRVKRQMPKRSNENE